MRTAVVLGAGGFTGQAFHAGALCALEEVAGFDAREAHVLVGTSAGSLVAAGLAGGLAASDLTAELLGDPLSEEGQLRRTAARGQVEAASAIPEPGSAGRWPLDPLVLLRVARRPFRSRPAAVVSSLLPPGRVDTAPLARSVRYLHGNTWPDRDLRICAVRARDARRVVFGTPRAPRTDVGTAVAASCAIPAYFAPVRIDGHSYVDGGMHSPTNADVVLRDAPDLVVVLSPMSVGSGVGLRPDLGVRLAMKRRLNGELRRLRRAGMRTLVIEPGRDDLAVMGFNPMHGGRIDEVVETVAASVRAHLERHPDVLELLAAAGPAGRLETAR
ncbi:MAG TPA: patatin-like phospholipase family protein [Mycobacteriales bacterium]|nr:patatin-like phospholipase family protein [Mycobacteriales bacterium]